MEMTVARGTAIGSIGRNTDLHIYKTSAKIFMSGVELVGIGSVGGEASRLILHDASCIIQMKGETCSAIAALDGKTDISVHSASVRVASSGKEALAIGGYTGDTAFEQDTADTHITMESPLVLSDYLKREQLSVKGGLFVMTHNGEEIFNLN
jgi:hypothetical protein